MKVETFPFPQLLYLLVRYARAKSPGAAGFPAKWKQKKEKRSFYLKNYNAASSSMLAQSSVHERFINLLHQQTAMLKFLDYNRMLHLSFSSDAQRICTCGSIEASGFKFSHRHTGHYPSFLVSRQMFGETEYWFCKDLFKYSCLGKSKDLQNLGVKEKES